MKNYETVIGITYTGSTYNADSYEEAEKIAQAECDEIFAKLNGSCSVEVINIKEMN